MFTFNEHEENGKKLQQIYDYVLELSIRTANKYGLNDVVTKKANDAYKAISGLKSALDDKVCSEHPNKPDHEVTSVYYRNGKNKDAA
jgi:hypothetical protein